MDMNIAGASGKRLELYVKNRENFVAYLVKRHTPRRPNPADRFAAMLETEEPSHAKEIC